MARIEDVLRRHGYSVSEAALAGHLDALLSEQRTDLARIDMSTADVAFLVEYAGVRPASESELSRLDAQSAARAAAEAARTLRRGDVATLLGIDPSRVSHQVTAGRLYSYPGNNGRPVFPDWQFAAAGDRPTDNDSTPAAVTIPHLAAVVAAIPAGSHPMAVRTFMTTPNPDLSVAESALSPRDWLIGGGDPADVEGLAGTLGEQI